MKKISIIGRGTVGCLAVAHFLKWTDLEIEWIYDPLTPTTPVGEGTNLAFPKTISLSLDFDSSDMEKIYSTPKMGIWKRGWGKGKDFKHTFKAGSVGMHFNALEFQSYVFKKIANNSKLNIFEKNITDTSTIDSDYIIVCSGSPKVLTDDFQEHTSIPVNSALVFQCPWNLPKFLFSLTFAKKYGWVFGIPLVNRCAIGYVYNSNFCNEEDIKKDVQSILNEFDLTPNVIRNLKFYNYSRKKNFSERICYNGNASFFLEPLEATSTGFADCVNRLCFDYLSDRKSLDQVNNEYKKEITDIELMINLHYFSGSVYKNDFWDYAKKLSEENIDMSFKMKSDFSVMINHALNDDSVEPTYEIGSWPIRSYRQNISNLGITDKLKDFIVTK